MSQRLYALGYAYPHSALERAQATQVIHALHQKHTVQLAPALQHFVQLCSGEGVDTLSAQLLDTSPCLPDDVSLLHYG